MDYLIKRTVIAASRLPFGDIVAAEKIGTAEDIDRLLALGAIAPVPDDKAADGTASVSPVDPSALETLSARVFQAMVTLPADGFTSSGKPSIEALHEALPQDAAAIDAAFRDTIWTQVKATQAT